MQDKPKSLLVLGTIFLLLIILVYSLNKQGRLPFNLNSVLPQENPISQIQPIQTRTTVQEENAIIQSVDQTSPSVVAIGVNQRIGNPQDPFSIPKNQQNTIATGFIASEKGTIVTNKHVVSNRDTKYSIVTKDGKKLEITKIYRDPTLDLALIKVNGNDLKALELGESSKLKVGQTVIAIGNALGRFSNTVTTGVVSGLGRTIGAGDPFSGQTEQLDGLIQTDAAINPGNSGGPLLNSAAQVIGVNVAVTEGAQNIGFAIPIDTIKALIEEFDKNGEIQRAFLGISYRLITRDIAILNEVPQGAYIQEVVPESAAEKAGINPGDIITKIDDQQINSETKISEIIQRKKIGEKVSLEVWTDGNTKTVTATLEQLPE